MGPEVLYTQYVCTYVLHKYWTLPPSNQSATPTIKGDCQAEGELAWPPYLWIKIDLLFSYISHVSERQIFPPGGGGMKGCIRCHEQTQDDGRLAVGADG
jgi:hypothetical protein